MLHDRPTTSLFGIGAATLLLLLIGIHNAWDTVTWMAFQRFNRSDATPTCTGRDNIRL